MLVALAGLLPAAVSVFAAETVTSLPMTKTLILLRVDGEGVVPIQSSFRESPPTITLQFPKQRLTASLPERSTLGRGAIQAITAEYGETPTGRSPRFLRAIHVVLAAPYAYHVRSESGQIVIEIEHPVAVNSESVQVGLPKFPCSAVATYSL